MKIQFSEPRTNSDILVQTLLNSAPVEFEKTLADANANSATLREAIDQLDAIITGSARLRGYLDGRYGHGCGDQGHKDSVKESNKLVKKIRKALGFTYAGNDLSF